MPCAAGIGLDRRGSGRRENRPFRRLAKRSCLQSGSGFEITQALMPPTPIESLPAAPGGTGQPSVKAKRSCTRAISGLSSVRASGVGKITPRCVAQILRGELPAAARAHAVAEGPLARRHQDVLVQDAAHVLDLEDSRPASPWRAGPTIRSPRARPGVHERLQDRRRRSGLRRRDDVLGVRRDPHRERLHADRAGKPFARRNSRSPTIQTAEPPPTWVPRRPVIGFETEPSAAPTRALWKRADHEAERRRIGGADDHGLGLAAADGIHRELQGHAERRAGGHRREGQTGDLAHHRDLCRWSVVDVPQQVRRHLSPGRRRAAPTP